MDQLPLLGKRELICLLLFTCNYYKRVDLCRSGSSPYPVDSKYKGTPVIASKNTITIMFMIPSNKQVKNDLLVNNKNGKCKVPLMT